MADHSVSEAIDRLVISGLVSLINLEVYEITEALTKRNVGEIFSERECELLSKLAGHFSVEIKSYFPSWHKKHKT